MKARLKRDISKTEIINLIKDKYTFFNCDEMPGKLLVHYEYNEGSYWLEWRCCNSYGLGDEYKAFLTTDAGRVTLLVTRYLTSATWCDSACEPCTCKLKRAREKEQELITLTIDDLKRLGWLEYYE